MSTHTHKPCTEALPVIRLAAHVTPQSLAQALLHACTTDGFFYLADHGIPQALIEEVFAISRGYFLTAGPEQKLKGNGDLGYTAVRQESLDSVMPGNGDVKESYYYGDDRWFVRKGVTQFVPPFLAQTTRREKLDSFVDRNTMVAQIILRGLALALGLEEDYLAKAHTGEHSRLRLLHYPEHSYRGVDHLDIRAGAHTDYGTITLLHQDRVSGLQVIKDGVWTDVPPRPGCVVVNIGDALEFWSGGKFRSTRHRVVMPRNSIEAQSRFSMAFFYHPDDDTLLRPLGPSQLLLDSDKKASDEFEEIIRRKGLPPGTRDLTGGEYLRIRIEATYGTRS